MGTEDQIHKGDSKYQKAKIKNLEVSLSKIHNKNTEQNQSQKIVKYIYGICF